MISWKFKRGDKVYVDGDRTMSREVVSQIPWWRGPFYHVRFRIGGANVDLLLPENRLELAERTRLELAEEDYRGVDCYSTPELPRRHIRQDFPHRNRPHAR